ncbi:unnamed protein product [Ilex paraguariensis]|uniref:Uncharacterized protein n=1 Tax=Ilex paraguariensis TaxID=185542 RepID=A0ABC8V3Y1_9AQUA
MAPQADLTKIALEGFGFVDQVFGRKGRLPAPQRPPPQGAQRDCQYQYQPQPPYSVVYQKEDFSNTLEKSFQRRDSSERYYQHQTNEPCHVFVKPQASIANEKVNYYQHRQPREAYALVHHQVQAPVSAPKETVMDCSEAAKRFGGFLVTDYR